jgi:hypothetical protein
MRNGAEIFFRNILPKHLAAHGIKEKVLNPLSIHL